MREQCKRWLGKPRRAIALALSAVVLAGVVVSGAVLLLPGALNDTEVPWENLGIRVGLGVAQNLGSWIEEGLGKGADFLAAISPPGKPITVEDLTRWLELVQRGEAEQAAGEFRARYTDQERRQVREAMMERMPHTMKLLERAAGEGPGELQFTDEEVRQFRQELERIMKTEEEAPFEGGKQPKP